MNATSRRPWPLVLVGALACVLSARPATAQLFRGTVTELSTGNAVPGVVITLLSSSGTRSRVALTDATGRYAVAAPQPGRYVLEAKRIGVRRVLTDTVAIAAGETRVVNIAVAVLPVMQAAVTVNEKQRCGVAPDQGEATAELWEDARAALAAERVTAASFQVAFVTYQRDLDAKSLAVKSEERHQMEGTTTSPFVSASAEELSKHGYVVDNASGGQTYRAPDATVLLSDAFAREHCFRPVVGTGDDQGLVGLGFVPTDDRKQVADINGTLWLDAASRELRRVDFIWTSVANLDGHEQLGGRVEFQRLPTGTWIVSRWRLRLPMLDRVAAASGFSYRRVWAPEDRLMIRAIREVGGEVQATSLGTTGTILGAITGIVTDSLPSLPLAGARVTLAGTVTRAVTGPDGGFTLSGVPDGVYTLTVHHPRLDSLGVPPLTREVRVEPGHTETVTLSAPTVATARRQVCPAALPTDRPGIVRGSVRRQDGSPVGWAVVEASWTGFERDGRGSLDVGSVSASAVTDSAGAYRLCGVTFRPLRLTVRDSTGVQVVLLPFRADTAGITVRDAVLPKAVADSHNGLFVARVADATTGAPIPGAEVMLGDAGRSVRSDSLGKAVMRGLPAGPYRVEVRRPGYQPLAGTLQLSAGDSIDVRFPLEKSAVALDTVQVKGKGAGPWFQADFDRRRANGQGVFITTEILEQQPGSQLAEVIASKARRVRLVPLQNGGSAAATNSASQCSAMHCQPLCFMTVWRDGQLTRNVDLSGLDVTNVAAVEVYTSITEIPLEFSGTGSSCGVIVIWSRAAGGVAR